MNSFNREKVKLACLNWAGFNIEDEKLKKQYQYAKCLCYPKEIETVVNIIKVCDALEKSEISLSNDEFAIIAKFYK
jgi:reverse gyrase